MVIDYQGYDYYGKYVLEKMIFKPPFNPISNFENEACFFYTVNGQGSIYGGVDKANFQTNESLLLKCGQYVSHFPLENKRENEPYEVIGIHITPALLKNIYDNKLPPFLTTAKNKQKKVLCKIDRSIVIDEFIKSLLFYFNTPELITEEIIELKIKELIFLLYKLGDSEILDLLGSLLDPTELSFKNIIEANLFEDLSIKEFSILTNDSLSTFKRKFKQVFNDSPAKYITDQRLNKAAQLLKVTHLRITDICYQCGFSNTNSFSKTFIRKFHMSPTEYRKSN